MAKICPITKKPVIYLTCAECEHKVDCRSGNLDEQKKEKKVSNE